MTSLETYFNNSQPLDQYIAAMTENKENLESIYHSFSLPNNDQRLDQLKTSNYKQSLSNFRRLVWRCYDEHSNFKTYQ